MTLSSATGVVFDALERAGCQPRGPEHFFRARCPAHDSDAPSLRVTLADDGRALLNCKVGCDVGAIVDALGLTWAHLFPPRKLGAPLPTRLSVEQRLADRLDASSCDADHLLMALRGRFGDVAHRATGDHCAAHRTWTGRCPACRADQLVIVEDEHDPLDRQDEQPAVRATCFGCGATTDEIRAELGVVAM